MDTNYVKFFVQYSNKTAGGRENTEIPIHTCNEKDYARFYPVESRSAKTLDSFKTDPKKRLYCLDQEKLDSVRLWGT